MSLVGELRRVLPSFKMDGREKKTGKGGGRGREKRRTGSKGEGGEEPRGTRPGGGGRKPRFKQIGAGIGGRLPARPGPRELGPPTHGPGNSLAHRLGRAGQGRAKRAGCPGTWTARPWKVQTHQWGARRAAVKGSEGAGPERSPQGQPACHFLICWADFLSPEGDGAGRAGGAC